jgi:hypothetical protein
MVTMCFAQRSWTKFANARRRRRPGPHLDHDHPMAPAVQSAVPMNHAVRSGILVVLALAGCQSSAPKVDDRSSAEGACLASTLGDDALESEYDGARGARDELAALLGESDAPTDDPTDTPGADVEIAGFRGAKIHALDDKRTGDASDAELDDLRRSVNAVTEDDVSQTKAAVKMLLEQARAAEDAGDAASAERLKKRALDQLDRATAALAARRANRTASDSGYCPPPAADVIPKHGVCKIHLAYGRRTFDGKSGAFAWSGDAKETDLVSFALDFEADGEAALQDLAKKRLTKALSAMHDAEDLDAAVPDGTSDETSIAKNACQPAGIGWADDAAVQTAIQCETVQEPRVVVLNYANLPQTAQTNDTCAAGERILADESRGLTFPTPDQLYCYFSVDKTQSYLGGNIQASTGSTASSSSDANGSASSFGAGGALSRFFGPRVAAAQSSSSSDASASSDASTNSYLKFNAALNTQYRKSSSFILEQWIRRDPARHTSAAAMHQDACNMAQERYLKGNTLNDVLAGCVCTSERLLPESNVFVYKWFPY